MQKALNLLNEIEQQYLNFINYTAEDAYSKRGDISSFKLLCINMWHLHEWIWNESPKLKTKFVYIGKYREYLFKKCSELEILHDIANMSKHSKLERNKSCFKELTVFEGDIMSFQNPPYVKVIMNDGTYYNGTEMLEKVFQFLGKYMNELH